MNKFTYTGAAISKNFDHYIKVFSNVDFNLTNSSSLAITGPNGSGKSTLIKIMAAVLSYSFGKLSFNINGKELAQKDYISHYSFVAPYLQIYEEFTPKEMLEIYCKFKNESVDHVKFDLLLNMFNLSKRKNEAIKSFSSGMKQRMKYILAFHTINEIILLDEPFTNLDHEGIDVVSSLIEDYRKSGSSIVIASNDDREINLCTDILDLKK